LQLSDADGSTLHEAITALAHASAAPLAIATAAPPHAILWANDAFRESARRTTGLIPEAIGADCPDLTLAVAGLVGAMPEAVHAAADPADPTRILLRVDPLAGKLKTTLLETIVNHLPDVIYAKDRDARFIFKNLSDVSLMGATSQPEIIGKTDFDYYPPEIAQAFFDDDMRVIGGEPVIGKIEKIIGEDGRLRRYSTTKVPLRADDGRIVGLVGCGHDVTERYEMGRALERLAEERQAEAERAREALETKARFLAVMSHEIRTPLTGMLGVARLLSETALDPEQQRLVATITECGEGLSSILNNLLDFSRIEAGGLELEAAPFDLADIASAARNLYAPHAAQKGLSFNAELRGGGQRRRLGDRHRLMQIVHNLLSNAFKFTEQGAVVLTLDMLDDLHLRLSVCDSGIGLSEEAARRIVAPFCQADQSTARRFGGTGLGLSIVQGLVEAMGGSLSVESKPGQGACFHATLCLAADKEASSGPEPTRAPPKADRSLNVLAADDSAVNRLVLEAALKGAGHRVTLAEDGEAAVRLARERDFDALLMDVSMPGLDGDIALRRLRAEAVRSGRSMPPAIALTGYAEPEHRTALMQSGFAAVIAKPYRIDDLLAALAQSVAAQADIT
jgi:PAS domain S-box-containing protein